MERDINNMDEKLIDRSVNVFSLTLIFCDVLLHSNTLNRTLSYTYQEEVL